MKNIRLKDIAIVTSGNSAPQNDKMFEDGIYPFVRTSDVGRVHLSASFTKPEDYLNETGIKGMKLFPKDSILFPKSGASTLLNHRVLLGEDSYVVSHLAVIVPDKSKVVPLYLYYYTTRIDAGELVNDRAYPSLKTSILEQVSLNLPSLAEQERIVTELDLLTGIIDKQKSQLKELDNLAQSIFYDMFGDPVENEKGWQTVRVGSICKDVSYGTSSPASESGKFIYLRMNNITYQGELDLGNVKYIDLSDEDFEKYSVREGDVLFNRTNSADLVGKTTWFHGLPPMVIAGYIIRIRLDSAVFPVYFSSFMNTKGMKILLKAMGKGAVNQSNINAKELRSIILPLPPLALQESFAQKIESIESQKAAINRSIAETQKLFDYTMDKYFG